MIAWPVRAFLLEENTILTSCSMSHNQKSFEIMMARRNAHPNPPIRPAFPRGDPSGGRGYPPSHFTHNPYEVGRFSSPPTIGVPSSSMSMPHLDPAHKVPDTRDTAHMHWRPPPSFSRHPHDPSLYRGHGSMPPHGPPRGPYPPRPHQAYADQHHGANQAGGMGFPQHPSMHYGNDGGIAAPHSMHMTPPPVFCSNCLNFGHVLHQCREPPAMRPSHMTSPAPPARGSIYLGPRGAYHGAHRPGVVPNDRSAVGSGVEKGLVEKMKCTPCDKEFSMLAHYQTHMATHIKCAECDFSATPKFVNSHMKTSHFKGPSASGAASGSSKVEVPAALLQLIPPKYRFASQMGDSEEEVRKWREERKKAWPTPANLKRKQEEIAERKASGELTKSEGSMNKRGASGSKRPRPASDAASESPAKKVKVESVKGEEADAGFDTSNEAAKLDEESGEGGVATDEVIGADADETDDKFHGTSTMTPEHKKPCVYFSRQGRCNKADKCRFAHVAPPPKLCSHFKQYGVCKNLEKCLFSHDRGQRREVLAVERSRSSKKPSTLLKKLLAKDRRKESSLILQCIKFFITTDFLKAPRATSTIDSADVDSGLAPLNIPGEVSRETSVNIIDAETTVAGTSGKEEVQTGIAEFLAVAGETEA